jgi:hypothetical protein
MVAAASSKRSSLARRAMPPGPQVTVSRMPAKAMRASSRTTRSAETEVRLDRSAIASASAAATSASCMRREQICLLLAAE